MHWRGTPGAGRGTPVLKSREEFQACMWAWHARDWAWHANTKFQRATIEDTKGAWHVKLGVARLGHQLLWACHMSKGVWHANSPFQEEPSLWRATWCRRRGTPGPRSHLGVPLENPGVACQAWRVHKSISVPLEQHGVACWYNNPEKWLKAIEDRACHLSNQAWHTNAQRTKNKDWVCHLVSKAWHASTSFQRQRKVRKARGVPLEFEGVARQHKKSTMACHLSSKAWHAKVVRGTSVPLEGLGVARQAGNEGHVTLQKSASHMPAEKSSINTLKEY
ncbi:uncharacterized protein DS421_15g505770 [Arachis hypogaea]|nr:uncharacterized protein DS421_15g505770 [Arachis hypogaea]